MNYSIILDELADAQNVQMCQPALERVQKNHAQIKVPLFAKKYSLSVKNTAQNVSKK